MRQLIYILPILIFLISCKNDFKENSLENGNDSEPIEVIDFDSDFNRWLNKLDLENDDIIDTSEERTFELWAYRDRLTTSDSAFYWYPSKDSSFYLITNFNRETKKRISTEYSNDIDLRFLNRNSKSVYIGLTLLDSLAQRSIDFYWYDSTTFFFIENLNNNNKRNLIKLKMGIDSIWTYKIKE